MLDGALSWLDRGFAVFPLRPRDKVPLGSLVPHGLKDATREAAVIRDWWQREPKANIGLRTGGGRFVIDLDGPDATALLAGLCRDHGGAPKTLTVKTARGFHVFLANSVEVPNSTGRIAPGVDIRGIGGYVVAPPSEHPSGFVYSIRRDLPIADAPGMACCAGDAAAPKPLSPRKPGKLKGDDCINARVASLLSLVANAGEGERNKLLHWSACRFSEMVSAEHISQSQAEESLMNAGAAAGLAVAEVARTVPASVRRCGDERPP